MGPKGLVVVGINMEHLQDSVVKFAQSARSQGEKGIKKYGQPLDPLDKRYNFLEMAIEEQVDGFQYLYAEQVKRKHITDKIREIIKYNVPPKIHGQIETLLNELEGK